MNTENTCKYCHRTFHSKESCEKHTFQVCFWIHKSKKDKEKEIDSYELPLTDNQRDNIIRKLSFQVYEMSNQMNKMQKEIQQWKQKNRKHLLEELNKQDHKPTQTIEDWFNNISITQLHLEYVFQNSLKDGIKQVLDASLKRAKLLENHIPLCAFSQQKTIYVYCAQKTEKGTQSKWVCLDSTKLKTYLQMLGTKFFDMFLLWQTENESYLKSSPHAEERHILFMQKVMEDNYSAPSYINKMTEFIYQQINIPFVETEYI